MTTLTATVAEPAARIAGLTDQYLDAAARFAALAQELSRAAADLAHADDALRVARYQARLPRDLRPCARELAAELLEGRCGALRPYVRFVPQAAADRAEEALIQPPRGAREEAGR